VTPLAVFAFEDGSMRLRSVHPHASEQDVRRRTGFPLPAGAAPKTPAPSAAEQAALDIVDPFDRLAAVDLRPDGGEP
jgi:hypothetical protein